VPVEVRWDELAVADHADSYADFFGKVYFRPLVAALRAITIDELGKTALRDSLAKIVLCNSDRFYSVRGVTFADGVLTFDHQPHTNIDEIDERTKGLQQILESGL